MLGGRPYLPWTEWSLRPAALVTVLNEIVLGRRKTVVELGSGASTVVIARLMAERGGTLVSVEHEPTWADLVGQQLASEGLSDTARVLSAPLGPHDASWSNEPWYSRDAIATLPGAIDLLLIDGPPGFADGNAHSRYPALVELAGRLAPNAVVILDDADREPEREIVERWQQDLPEWQFGIDADAGIAVGTRR